MKTTNLIRTLVTVAGLAVTSLGVAQTDAITKEDKEFLKNASEMGSTEVSLGQLAVEKGTGADVKALGAKLVADHTASTQEISALAKAKKVDIAMIPAATQRKMLSSFEGKTGAEFDKEFREHVAKDHEKAIKMFTDAAADAKDADVKAFALKNIPVLNSHFELAGAHKH
jgi:putative membrane protein